VAWFSRKPRDYERPDLAERTIDLITLDIEAGLSLADHQLLTSLPAFELLALRAFIAQMLIADRFPPAGDAFVREQLVVLNDQLPKRWQERSPKNEVEEMRQLLASRYIDCDGSIQGTIGKVLEIRIGAYAECLIYFRGGPTGREFGDAIAFGARLVPRDPWSTIANMCALYCGRPHDSIISLALVGVIARTMDKLHPLLPRSR